MYSRVRSRKPRFLELNFPNLNYIVTKSYQIIKLLYLFGHLEKGFNVYYITYLQQFTKYLNIIYYSHQIFVANKSEFLPCN